MLGRILSLLVVVVVGYIVYATFFGNDKDKAQRDNLIDAGKNVGQAIWGLFKHEKGKYDSGEYDKAISNISETLAGLKKANDMGDDKAAKRSNPEHAQKLKALEEEKKRLEALIVQEKKQPSGNQAQLVEDLKKLGDDISKLANDMGK